MRRYHWEDGDIIVVDDPPTDAMSNATLLQQWQHARAEAERLLGREFNPNQPRDPDGKWGSGGGSGSSGGAAGGDKDEGKDKDKDKLGPGYSDKAKLKDGVIHTSNVYDAVRALHEGRKVELKQPKQLSTLIKKLGEITKEMEANGETAPNFDLCNVTVKGTNLFCADTKGIPRIKMPQLDQDQTKAFVQHLKDQGYKVEKGNEKSENLRATQNQLIGAKVAKIAKKIGKDPEGEANQRRLIISRDDYILDGHHHWAGQIAHDAKDNKLGNHKTKVTRIDIGITKLLEEANKFTGGKGAKGTDEKRARWRKALAEARRWLAREWDESKHPRVPAGSESGGEFGSGGGGGGDSDKPDADTGHLDPKVISVGGDEWNRQTAIRLEREYQTAKPALEELTVKYGGAETAPADDTPVDEDTEESPYVPESWDEMSDDHQSQAFEKYKDSTLSEYVESEKQSWYDNGDALDDAKMMLAENPDKDNWLEDTLKEHLDEGDTRYPLTAEQLANVITLEYDNGNSGSGDLTIEYADKSIAGYVAETTGASDLQQTMPGIEPEDLSKKLTQEMRDELTAFLEKSFDKKTDSMTGDMTPPDYLAESAAEFQDENWNHNMDDKQKFEWTKNNTDLLDDPEVAEPGENVQGLPTKFDPLNETTGADYKRTQKLARALSIERAKQVLRDRKLPDPGTATLKLVDTKLWSAWKSSSTNTNGQLLQVATAEELGGRLNMQTGHGGAVMINRNDTVDYANNEFKDIGGYKGVLAYVRAKWETTQYLLDKAGVAELKLYRGINLAGTDKLTQAEKEKLLAVLRQMVEGHAKVPTLEVVRNGAASTSTDPNLSNGWGASRGRVVLRAHVPRTAAVSIPAYGINVQSEHEVVVAGTAWKGWDAWIDKAPHFDHVPMAA